MMTAATALLTRLTGSPFRRNVFVLVRANVVSQALLLLATPILTRLFGPEDFGVAGLLTLVASFILSFATLRYEWSIPSADTDRDARLLAAFSLMTTLIAGVLLLVLFTLTDHSTLLGLVGMQPAAPFAPLLPVLVVAGGAIAVLSSIYVRSRSMEIVAKSKYLQTGVQLVTSLSTGFAGMGAFGLVCSYAVASATGMLLLWRGLPHGLLADVRDVAGQLGAARRYLAQAGLSTVVSLANFAFLSSLPLLLSIGYSVREVGLYFIATRLVGGPTTLISSGIAASFWGEAAALAKSDPHRLRILYLRLIRRLALASLLIVAAALGGALLLPVILGSGEWGDIGIVVIAILPQVVGGFVFSSTNHLIVYGRQGYQLASDLISVSGSIGILLLARALLLPFWITIAGVSIVIFCAYLLRFALHLKANSEIARASTHS